MYREITVIRILYHTNKASFNVIRRPRTPVKPQRNTAACNLSKAFFIMPQRKEINDGEEEDR
jgi:hypothetical protein